MTQNQPTERLSRFSRGELVFDVVDSGPEDGQVILLLHGFPQRVSSWSGVMDLLNKAGYRTIAPDQRGYSAGARPRGRLAYRSRVLADDVAALIRAVGEGPVHLVGHDWGACIAYVCAARHPALLRSLTTISVPHPSAFVGSMTRSLQARRSWYMAFFQLPFLPEYLMKRRHAARTRILRAAGMSAELIGRFEAEIIADGALTGAINYYRALPLIGKTPSVTIPTTHVWSDQDALLLRKGAQLNEKFVDAPYELRVIAGASHWLPDERADEIAAIILERARAAPTYSSADS